MMNITKITATHNLKSLLDIKYRFSALNRLYIADVVRE